MTSILGHIPTQSRPIVPTDEQLAIVEAARTTRDNLIIEAYAGAAKTSTLVLICQAVTGIAILSLAFNKKIADEMTKRLPSHVKAQTLNSLGHGVWGSALGKRLTIDADKAHNLFKTIVDEASSRERSALWDNVADIKRVFNSARMSGYIPREYANRGTPLMSRDEFYASLDEEPEDLVVDTVEHMLGASIHSAYQGLIDFNDQLYMPTLFGGTWPRFPLTLGDEVQDFSILNLHMLSKIVGDRRVMGVGDRNQSIYGFRGAHSTAMDVMKERFNMRALPLSISFRCPQSVIKNVHWRVPNMRWPDWAEEGSVSRPTKLHMNSVPDGAVFICRNNAPLFSVAMNFLKHGRGIRILGSDIGPGLIKVLKGLGPETLTQDEALMQLAIWREGKEKKTRAKASLADRYDCLRFFIKQGPTLSAAIAYAEHLFKAQGPVQFSSGHKSKGLEWDHVYHLDPHLIGKYAFSQSEHDQEHNVHYVIETRAKKSLTIVNSEDIIYDTPNSSRIAG